MTPEQLAEIERLAEAQELLRAGAHALPLVKALWKARAALEWQAAMTKALSESQERLAQEVKEARAEVERLKGAITRFVDQYPWQQGPEIQELKALKEGAP